MRSEITVFSNGNPTASNFFEMNFAQFVNHNARILGRESLYLPSLKMLFGLKTLSNFLITHTFVCKFGWADVVRRLKNIYIQKHCKLEID